MVYYRYLGYGTTDSGGMAKLDHDANGNAITHSYTGVGAGKIKIVASLDSTITDNSIISDEVELLDCLWIDDGTATGHKTSWYNYQTILTVDYPSTYDATRVRKLEENDTQRYYYYNDSAISTTKVGGYNSITTPSCIEFDVLSYVGTIQLALYDGTNSAIQEINANGHYKIVCNGTTAEFYKETEGNYSQLSSPKTFTGSNYRFGFGFNAQNEGIVFKDFMIYPI